MRTVHRYLFRTGFLAMALVLLAAPATAQKVVLVRHAEKADDGTGDPPLTAYGTARAQALAGLLTPSGLTAAITSPRIRTIDTAAPAVKAFGADTLIVGFSGGMGAHLAATAEAVRRFGPDDVVLVVGHSNTIPALVGALGGPDLPELNEAEYDVVFFLDLTGSEPAFSRVFFRPLE